MQILRYETLSLWECFAGMVFQYANVYDMFFVMEIVIIMESCSLWKIFAVMVFQYGDNEKARLALLAQTFVKHKYNEIRSYQESR